MIITKKGIKKELVGKCKICNCEFKTNTYETLKDSIRDCATSNQLSYSDDFLSVRYVPETKVWDNNTLENLLRSYPELEEAKKIKEGYSVVNIKKIKVGND